MKPLKLIVWDLYETLFETQYIPKALKNACLRAQYQYYCQEYGRHASVYKSIENDSFDLFCYIVEYIDHHYSKDELMTWAIMHNRPRICKYLTETHGIRPVSIWSPSTVALFNKMSQQNLFDMCIEHWKASSDNSLDYNT